VAFGDGSIFSRSSEAFFARAELDDVSFREAKFHAFASVLQLHMMVSLGTWAWTNFDDWRRLIAIPLQVAFYLVLTRTRVRLGLLLTLSVVAFELSTYPLEYAPGSIANHNAIEWLALATLVLVNHRDEAERELALRALRWLLVLVVVLSGLQKVWHGTYFQGQFLSWAVSTGRQWSTLVGSLLSTDELTRLQGYSAMPFVFEQGRPISPPPGPYIVSSWPVLVASNAVWIGEIVLPCLLLIRRTRVCAALLLGLLFVAIEVGARELFFGALIINFLLLFAQRDWCRLILPGFVPVYLFLALARLGVIGVEIPR
jgi:hypothetical protein